MALQLNLNKNSYDAERAFLPPGLFESAQFCGRGKGDPLF